MVLISTSVGLGVASRPHLPPAGRAADTTARPRWDVGGRAQVVVPTGLVLGSSCLPTGYADRPDRARHPTNRGDSGGERAGDYRRISRTKISW